jgi:hypothetical protein
MLALRSYQLIQFYCLFSSSRSNCFGPQGLVSTKLSSSSRLFLKTVQFYGTNNVDSKISGFRPLIKWLIDEARRYWKATKNIWFDYLKAQEMTQKALIKPLNRTEIRFIQRARRDFFLLIPYAIFLLLPGSTYVFPFLVAVILKWFPHLFPVAYWSEKQNKDHIERLFEFRRANAEKLVRIFQSLLPTEKRNLTASKLLEDDVSVVSSLQFESLAETFEENVTLRDWPREHLKVLARYYDVPTLSIRTSSLRRKVLQRVVELRTDDKLIAEFGLESLNDEELNEAIRLRGFVAVTPIAMGDSSQHDDYQKTRLYHIALLRNWLNLSLKQTVPHTVLIFYAIYIVFANASI